MQRKQNHELGDVTALAVLVIAIIGAATILPGSATAQSEGEVSVSPYPEAGAGQALIEEAASPLVMRSLPPVEPCDYQVPVEMRTSPHYRSSILDEMELDVLVRGYYLNDQRIEWSGLEATFGAEAQIAPKIQHCWNGWDSTVEGEFYLNQPFDRNVLVDTQERVSYEGNWDYEPFEISKLFLSCQRGNLLLKVGKFKTPFGRTHFPLFTNARLDAPFIRTESILWRETGLLMHYTPGCFVADVALTNGCEDRDTNSSKALVSRLGIQRPGWEVGISVKAQDGIGSEGQKQYRNHVGMDWMFRRERWSLSGEVITDQYGFRRPGFDPNDITWGRSIYYRDQNDRLEEPIDGIGYYINFDYCADCWSLCLNYGEYYPEELGDPLHDEPNRRGIVKFDYQLTPCSDVYVVVMQENSLEHAQDDRIRRGSVLLCGFQWTH